MSQENQFSTKMHSQSDSELRNYILNKRNFQEDAILAAAWELEKRNKADESSLKVVDEIYQKQKREEIEINKTEEKTDVTDNPNAPELFHAKFILFFGVFFSVFGGSILMAMNLSRIGKKREAWMSVFTGLIYSIIQIIVLNQLDTSSLTMPVSFLGMYLLEFVIWKKNVSLELKYRKRKIWAPLIVALIIWAPIVYATIATL